MRKTLNVSPLLILDIDGVMNTTASALRYRSGTTFTPESIIAMRWLLAKTGARIVISSTRRRSGLQAMQDLFNHNQLGDYAHRIIDLTPFFVDADTDDWREDEIMDWLDSNSCDPACIVIVDDKPFSGPLKQRLLQTDAEQGLTLELAKLAVAKWGI